MDLGSYMYININLNTVLSDQQQKKNRIFARSASGMSSKSGPPLAFFFFIRFTLFSLISSFQADLFGWWGGGGGCVRTHRTPCLRACTGFQEVFCCPFIIFILLPQLGHSHLRLRVLQPPDSLNLLVRDQPDS